MNKQVKHSYGGMMQDLSKSKLPSQYYFEGRNIRTLATNSQSSLSITNEKGNKLVVTIPIPIINGVTKIITYSTKTLTYTTDQIDEHYLISGTTYRTSGTQIIIGQSYIRNNIIILTTDSNGFDCIWKIDDKTFDITLLYMRDLNFNIENPIQVLNNYENESIDKIYWVDSKNQLRFINVYHSIENEDLEELIDLNSNAIQMVGTFDFGQPDIIDTIPGGIHTSGMIQYAYNLYRINGSQTKISPLSELVSLDKGVDLGGGAINEVISSTPVVKVSDLDNTYTNMRLYAIKYTSFGEIPSVSLILDRDIRNLNEVIYYDDGNILESLSLEEFLFLGSDIILPKHINSKDNRMFLANYLEKSFDIDNSDPEVIDFRAFSFKSDSTSIVYDSLYEDEFQVVQGLDPFNISPLFTTLPSERHACINKDFNTYKFQADGITLGGEGRYLKYELTRNQIGVNGFTEEDSKLKFFKDNEIYRAGIQFYNQYGQNSLPKWIADFKISVIGNESNLNFFYSGFKIEFKADFYTWLNDDNNFLDDVGNFDDTLKPVGYRLLRADRTLNDRTILCQGILNSMISISSGSNPAEENGNPILIDRAEDGLKMPSLMRRFDYYIAPQRRVENYSKASSWMPSHPNSTASGDRPAREFQANNAGSQIATFVQNTKMMQMFSPEILFNDVNDISTTNLKVVARAKNDENRAWLKEYNLASGNTMETLKLNTCIDKYDVKAAGNESEVSAYDPTGLQYMGLIAHTNDTNSMGFYQFLRAYNGGVLNVENSYEIYKKAIISEKGQGRELYNNEPTFNFANTLEPVITDGGDTGDPAEKIDAVVSWGCRNATVVLKGPHAAENGSAVGNTTYFEDLFTDAGGVLYAGAGNNGDDYHGIIGEFTISENLIYLGNIYGGNSYEGKKRSEYLEFGEYNDIIVDTYECFTPGDIFVDEFKFTKLVKRDVQSINHTLMQITELVSVTLESTIDMKNRNDYSIQEWDSRDHPSFDEYQQYNKVYSQNSNLIIRRDLDPKFKKLNDFNTTIISTKLKTPGELIDSWTDLQPNNTLSVDGKFGPINSLHSFKDEIYAIQDKGLSFISINPRIQTQGSDGVAIQLGTGNVLDKYQYISTDSGTLNKWSVFNSPKGFYYYDTINKGIIRYAGQIQGITDVGGLHSYFNNNMNKTILEIDNPILKQGVSGVFDCINNDAIITFLQNSKRDTLIFNENLDKFISFYDYNPSIYIAKGDNLISTDPTNTMLYKHFEGDYNRFYGQTFSSYITLLVNPEADLDTVLDNIMYKSEIYLNDIDQPDKTLTHVRTYNEYQDSGRIPLILGRDKNLRRRFRDWNAILPRNTGTRERIRNPWVYLKLELDNTSNYKMILHDIVISYTV